MKALLMCLALVPVVAMADVRVDCEQFPGKRFYNTDRAALTIRTTEPLVLLVGRYRNEDEVVHIPAGGHYKNEGIYPGLSAYGKYVFRTQAGGMAVVPYRCAAEGEKPSMSWDGNTGQPLR